MAGNYFLDRKRGQKEIVIFHEQDGNVVDGGHFLARKEGVG